MTAEVIVYLAILAGGAVYALLCWVRPFAKHRRCKGSGARQTLILRRLRMCKRCKGSGLVLRRGRAVFNYFAHIHADATAGRPR
jgi:hypothetical protein